MMKIRILILSGIFCAALAGCSAGAENAGTAVIETEELPEDDKPSFGQEHSVSLIPHFTTDQGKPREEMSELNEILDGIRGRCEDALENDRDSYVIHTDITGSGNFLQATLYMTEDWISLGGSEREEKNILTLAYDVKNNTPLQCTEVLKKAGITGVSLSERAAAALTDEQERENLRSTEMQGFLLDGKGNLSRIYMKLEIDTGGEEPDQVFYSFNPSDDTLTPLSWK